MSDVDELKQRAARVWGLGDYTELAKLTAPASQELADACAVSAGQEVLDVAAGNGNFALAAAREGASVVASDLSPGMVELGRARSEAEGYPVEWVVADAEELPFEDARFDCAGSVFGAMFAPRPDRVASELFRVLRPGGTLGMANWIPEGPFSEMVVARRRVRPAPAGGRARSHGLGAGGGRARAPRRVRGAPGRSASGRSRSAGPRRRRLGTTSIGSRPRSRPTARPCRARSTTPCARRCWRSSGATPDEDGALAFDSPYLLVVARKRG